MHFVSFKRAYAINEETSNHCYLVLPVRVCACVCASTQMSDDASNRPLVNRNMVRTYFVRNISFHTNIT